MYIDYTDTNKMYKLMQIIDKKKPIKHNQKLNNTIMILILI